MLSAAVRSSLRPTQLRPAVPAIRQYSIVNTLAGRKEAPKTDEGVRICQLVGLKPETLKEYKECHEAVWPSVLTALRKANVVDYSIHYFEQPQPMLVAHMRYMGDPANFAADMAKVGEDPETQKWWKLTDPMQTSFIPGAVGSASGPGWWTTGEEVFRYEG